HSDRPESISPETPPPSLQVIHRVTPAYPGLARQAHIGGTVKLSVEVLPDGRVGNVRVDKGHPLLARTAADAIKKWRFQPYSAQSGKGTLLTDVIVNFRVQ